VVRDWAGGPVVIRNAPFLDDGTPMPTLYWLVGPAEKRAVDRLEASGGVREAKAAVEPLALEAAHAAYAQERDRALPDGWPGPRPSGGVGGTRQGVKCLHAHYAWYLAGGDDPVGRWVARQLGSLPAAAIDCGTNSTRLLVAQPGGLTLERINRITRLGEGVDETRRLSPAAIDRTMSALRDYRGVIDRFGVERIRMTATSAARDAANRDDFFAAAEAVVGVRPELLSGYEEGSLSFLGATSDLQPDTGPWLVVDIGGGSTELVFGRSAGAAPEAVRSLDMGCVRLTERFLAEDPPSRESMEAARRYAADLLDGAIREQPSFLTGSTLVGLAGTVASLAAIDQSLDDYDREKVHHYRLTGDRVEAMLDRLAAVPSTARQRIPGVEAGRAEVIVGGTIVLSEVLHRFGFAECLTSETDILDGLVLSTRA
jgi:exopolyphosphatase/guanosine-5'-triphosphate,3'-diphosphate pyrophosphatase